MENAVSDHKFKIGQSVNYTSGPFGAGIATGVYKITRLLPPEGSDFQYKIKSTAEPHERVAKESQLDRIDMLELSDRRSTQATAPMRESAWANYAANATRDR